MAQPQVAGASAATPAVQAPSVLLGGLAMVLARSLFTSTYSLTRMWQNQGLPKNCLNAYAYLLGAVTIAVALAWSRPRKPLRSEAPWLVLRGLAGGLTICFQNISVELGTPVGDSSTLTSINMISAALLGFAILGERFHKLHILAVLCSVFGAILISKPSFIFGGKALPTDVYIGYVMALFAGLAQSCIFVAGRKCAKVPVIWHALSSVSQTGLVFLVIPFILGEPDDSVISTPSLTLSAWLWIVLLAGLGVLAILFQSMAARICPAAISAVVNTSSSMFFSYLVQILFFGTAVSWTKGAGAILMLMGVCIVILAKLVEQRRASTQDPEALCDPCDEDVEQAAVPSSENIGRSASWPSVLDFQQRLKNDSFSQSASFSQSTASGVVDRLRKFENPCLSF